MGGWTDRLLNKGGGGADRRRSVDVSSRRQPQAATVDRVLLLGWAGLSWGCSDSYFVGSKAAEAIPELMARIRKLLHCTRVVRDRGVK